MKSSKIDEAASQSPRGGPVASSDTHTESGVPTDKAHLEAGDGALAGSIPAGLSVEELQRIAEQDPTARPTILVCLSGREDKDVATAFEYFGLPGVPDNSSSQRCQACGSTMR